MFLSTAWARSKATSSLLFVTPGPVTCNLAIFSKCSKLINFVVFFFHTGNYKVQLYDPRTGGFMPSSPGIGMHVEVKDPDDKVVLSRVNIMSLHNIKQYILILSYSYYRCTVLKEDLLLHHTHRENISFVCTRTAPNGFLVHSWYVARDLIG